MTILQSSQTRGFFDPISLGFFVDGDFEKLHYKNDDIRLKTKATIFHEITHYLQFYGTTFGNTYLFHQWASLVEKLEFIRELQKTEEYITTPLSRYEHKNPDEFTWVGMQSEKYYQQELYGLTHRLFDYSPLVAKDGGPHLVSSPLIIEVPGGRAYAVVGETILENQAVANELTALSFEIEDPELATRTVTSYYEPLPDLTKLNYIIIGQVLAHYRLIHIEPVIYFIVLNQLQIQNVAFRHSEYEMVRSLKRIIESFPHFSNIPSPTDDNELKDLVGNICITCSLQNPFDSLAELKKLRESEEIHSGKAVSWASVKIMEWILDNPYESIFWPKFSSPIHNVPILNVRDENQRCVSFFSNTGPTIAKEHLLEHQGYSNLLHLINSLLNLRKFKCPMFIESKPTVCDSCANCSGYIPNNQIKENCPQYKILIGQGIDLMNIKEKERK